MKTHVVRFRKVDMNNLEEVRDGLKLIETRAATPKYMAFEVGDQLEFKCASEKVSKKIVKKYHWRDVDSMVGEILFKKIMPSVSSVDEMKKVYSSYPEYDEKIARFGLVGFLLE
jgi:ASC-1-like (ASCH) protein